MRGFGAKVAVMTAVLVMAALIVHGIAVYAFVSSTTLQRVRSDIEAEMAAVRASLANHPAIDFAHIVETHAREHGAHRFIHSLNRDGQIVIAGNAWLRPHMPGWTKIDGPDAAVATALGGDVLVLTQQVAPHLLLSVGRGIHWIADVEDELFEILIWTLLGSIALAGTAGLVVNRVIARRLAAVTTTAVAIMRGDMSERVPVAGSGDEFDRLSATLNAMLDRLQQLMESLEQVSNDIAHDLRTPLARLRQGLERARRTATTPGAFTTAIDQAVGETDAMLATFTALLRIAQMESGALSPDFRRVDLSELIHSVAEAYEFNTAESGHTIITELADAPRIQGDRDLLPQAVVNLLENALTHTPRGTRIVISLSECDGDVRLSFADDGPGVPSKELQRIFQRFYRLETSRTTAGTGLGLSLVSAVVRAHGGRIAARDNHPGLRINIDFLKGASN
ncbi:MAG: HAMP domain-containing sensor histidine kinase [Hyphomicrobiaceae bacterium]